MKNFGILLSDIISLFFGRGNFKAATALPLFILPGTYSHSEMNAGFFVGNVPALPVSVVGLAGRKWLGE